MSQDVSPVSIKWTPRDLVGLARSAGIVFRSSLGKNIYNYPYSAVVANYMYKEEESPVRR